MNGLGAMRQTQQMDGITVLRPLLSVPRASIRAYATVQELGWIDDPSNEDTRYDRNFLRHQVMPLLESRWPQLKSGLVATAGGFQSAQEVLDELAEQDLQDAALRTHPCRLGVLGALNQDTVLSLSDGRRKNLLRYWIRTRCHTRPSEKSLQEFINQIGGARGDGMLSLKGEGGFFSLRTYRRGLFIIPESASAKQNRIDTRAWDGETVRLDEVDIRLRCERGRGVGLRLDLLDRAPLELRWTHGQARVAPSEAGPHRRRVRVLLQEQGVPPWERARIPMIFSQGEFICMPGVITAQAYVAGPSVSGARIVLEDLRVRQSAAGSGVSS